MKDILKLSTTDAIGNPPRTMLVADEDWIAQVPGENWKVISDLQLLPTSRSSALSREQIRGAELLVLEVDAEEAASLDRVVAVKTMFPDLPIIAAVANADITVMKTLLRHGVSDVISLPFEPGELAAEICNIGARIAEAQKIPLAPAISMLGALGRSGTTAVMLHLAKALVDQSERPIRICMIDLDLQGGQMALQAGVESSRSLLDLLEADDRLDQDMLRNVSTKVDTGLYVISAPSDMVPIEQVEVNQILRIIAIARAEFDLVLLDMPPAWTNWSLSVAADADKILMVTQQSLAHLRQARRCLDLFREVGVSKSKVEVIVNRASKRRFQGISVQDVADTLGCQVVAALREDSGELSEAIDQGKLVSAISRRNVFDADVQQLAVAVRDMMSGLK